MTEKRNFSSKTKKHYEPALALMILTILVVAGFQLFWIRQNYREERRNLEFRSNIVFRETILKLQGNRLKIAGLFGDSANQKISVKLDNVTLNGDEGLPGPHFFSDNEATGFLNDISIKLKDSLNRIPGVSFEREITDSVDGKNHKRSMTIALVSPERFPAGDSAFLKRAGKQNSNQVFRFLYRVDSLQDSLRVKDIDSACLLAFKQQGLATDYTVLRNDSSNKRPDRFMPGKPGEMNMVTIGFAHPVTYQLQLGKNTWFLIKNITYPILFSLFLTGLTIVSLIFLYRNLQKQRRLTAIKNDFISNVTHELKTPIATVGVAIEALRNFNALNDPLRTKEYLDISQNELNRLSMLVDKVLRLSMFENQELELKKEPVNLNLLVNEVRNSFQLQLEKRQAVCTLQTHGTDFTITADKMHITSVIYNLIDNALKYSPDKPAISVVLTDEKESVLLSVSDNGLGIAREYQAKIFDKFFRVPSGDTHNVKGYGLGLSYVARVVAKHGGQITVDSEKGKGSTFNIKLPKSHG